MDVNPIELQKHLKGVDYPPRRPRRRWPSASLSSLAHPVRVQRCAADA